MGMEPVIVEVHMNTTQGDRYTTKAALEREPGSTNPSFEYWVQLTFQEVELRIKKDREVFNRLQAEIKRIVEELNKNFGIVNQRIDTLQKYVLDRPKKILRY